MTRQDIIEDYEISKSGMILTKEKFEGEMLYMPYFWEAYLNGFSDDIDYFSDDTDYSEDETEISIFYLNQEDLEQFPELKDRKEVKFYQDTQGFIREI